MIRETRINIDGIPALQITCGDMPKGVVLFITAGRRRRNISPSAAIYWQLTDTTCSFPKP